MFVGGYPSKCANVNNSCQFQWSSLQTPTISGLSQTGMTVSISGTGFSTVPASNIVLIGTINSCVVTSATSTSITCTIGNAPAGTYNVNVNIVGKGLAYGSGNFSVTVPVQVLLFSPSQGGAGKNSPIELYIIFNQFVILW